MARILRLIFLLLAGLALIGLAAWQSLGTARRALGLIPTATPDAVILETFAPGEGPLAGHRTPFPVADPRAAGKPVEGPFPAGGVEGPFPEPVEGRVDSSPPAGLSLTPLDELGGRSSSPSTPPAGNGPSTPPAAAGTGVAGGSDAGVYLSAPEEPRPQPTEDNPAIPTRIVIPAIQLDAPVDLAGSQKIRLGSDTFYQWTAPDEFAAGWHTASAPLGEPGNTVLNGHNNVHGAVFGSLFRLKPGDMINVYSGERVFHFVITQRMVLQEADVPASQRVENARWLGRSDDIRLTLVTCWPNDTNSHRLIVVAAYVEEK